MNILITGCAGFIGFHLSNKLLKKKNNNVFGIDNLNNYYDVNLKKSRLKILKKNKNFIFFKKNIINSNFIEKIFSKYKFTYVIHLAAQAGVRHSIVHPTDYMESNLVGFFNLINSSRLNKIKHFIYASTSSVYGDSNLFPLKEDSNTNNPLTFYAASKKSNEVVAHSFSNIYKLPATGLRFFTVYGSYGRPDMALYKFVDSIYKNKPITLFNKGNHFRDFTHVNDVVDSIAKIMNKAKKSAIPHQILNISSNKPISLLDFIKIIENNLGKKSKIKKLGLQKGDVLKTHGSNQNLIKIIGKIKYTNIRNGIEDFINWYLKHNS